MIVTKRVPPVVETEQEVLNVNRLSVFPSAPKRPQGKLPVVFGKSFRLLSHLRFLSDVKLFSTTCETIYLGWDAPLLPRVASLLRERQTDGDRCDLGALLCVLPSSRGVRRFKELLQREMVSHDLQSPMAEVVTIGQLAERLYQPPVPVALELEQTLAWAGVLRQQHSDDLMPLLSAVPPTEPVGPWLELAGTLRRLHEELSANELSFREVMEAADTEAEHRRWKLLSRLFDQYLQSLNDAGLADPHWSRREAVLMDRCQTDRKVVLIGTSDLSDALVAMLRSIDSEVLSLVAAPPSDAFRFDEFGCVETTGWVDHHLPMEDEQLIGAGDIADQATAVAESLVFFGEHFSADQVTVGLTDESQVGPVEIELRGCGVSTHRNLGWTISQTAVGRLLDLASTYLQRGTWQALAALVRHADVARFVTQRLELSSATIWLTELDKLLSNHYPVGTRDPLSPKAMADCPLARGVQETIDDWLAGFHGAEQSIANWSRVVEAWLEDLYPEGTLAENKTTTEDETEATALPTSSSLTGSRTTMAVDSVKRLTQRFAKLNDRLDLKLAGGAAVEMFAGRMAEIRVAETANPEDVELLGWLDLALDDAEAMVVMGLNHPFVPSAVTSDPFLPGTLRTKLRMSDNERRYARDVYAMQVMLSCRKHIHFIVGRTAADRSPTPPSRLLAASDSSVAARRVRRLLGGKRERMEVKHHWDGASQDRLLPIPVLPKLGKSKRVKTMSVTAFRDYLVCPYRFYLRHVLRQKPLDDSTSELAANQFGDLIHGALETFGQSDECNESDREEIERLLLQHLHDYVTHHYGDSRSSAVTLQVAQAERRLKAVAREQAARVANGWRIHASEASVSEKDGAGISVDGAWMGLRGRFDRIDYHPATGCWAILDYKTHGHRPEKKHLKKVGDQEQWVDLQLPLYRMMIPFLKIEANPGDVQLGYFNISEKDEETKINVAEFSESQMANAESLIHDCIRGIWAEQFEPTADRVQFDDYGMILQTGVASRLLDQTDGLILEDVR